MYIIEPIANRILRRSMRSVLRFGELTELSVPRRPAGQQRCLLYVHIPFCESLCPYCSFHRYVFEEQLAQKYFDALMREIACIKTSAIASRACMSAAARPPSCLSPCLSLCALPRKFQHTEISVETNPNHVTPAYLEPLSRAGVNRLSVGVQSFDDTILKAIGRFEKYGSGQETFERLQQAAGLFDTLNIDLIFNMPLQNEESLRADLDLIDRLLPDQVTFYPLMTAPALQSVWLQTLGADRLPQGKALLHHHP